VIKKKTKRILIFDLGARTANAAVIAQTDPVPGLPYICARIQLAIATLPTV